MASMYDENLIENMDKTHLIFNMDDRKTLGVRGCAKVNYADVVGGGYGFTLVPRLRRGPSAILLNPFILFKNRD